MSNELNQESENQEKNLEEFLDDQENQENLENLESEEDGLQDENEDENEEREGEEEGEELLVNFGDDDAEDEDSKPAPPWVKELRKNNRNKEKKIRELEKKIEELTKTEVKPVKLGPKPTLEDCDYDSDEYEEKLSKWFEDKKKSDELEEEERRRKENESKEWQQKIDEFEKKKQEISASDRDEIVDLAVSMLSVEKQAIIVDAVSNPALMMYALGKNPKIAKELVEERNLIKFAAKVAKLEDKMKIKNRKAKTSPEKVFKNGNASTTGSVDNKLEKLREEAAKTGDMTKVIKYKEELRRRK